MIERETEIRGKAKIQGTREWAVAEINCTRGCPRGCLYCYARYNFIQNKGITGPKDWLQCQADDQAMEKIQKKYSGQVMFPTAHDIVADNFEQCLDVLLRLLEEKNQVLVVSKPSFTIFKELCSRLSKYKKQLVFRFTITARNHKILSIWEPFAPSYQERKQCLEYAFKKGYTTSVSVEPILDLADVVHLVEELLPFINHSIWLGKMNKIDKRVVIASEEIREEVLRIKNDQNDESIHLLYRRLKDYSLVRWKESIKDVVGLPRANAPGLDL